MSMWNLKKVGKLKFKKLIIWIAQLFDLLWYKNVELKWKFGADNWISFFNSIILIDFEKWIELKKINLSQKLS